MATLPAFPPASRGEEQKKQTLCTLVTVPGGLRKAAGQEVPIAFAIVTCWRGDGVDADTTPYPPPGFGGCVYEPRCNVNGGGQEVLKMALIQKRGHLGHLVHLLII